MTDSKLQFAVNRAISDAQQIIAQARKMGGIFPVGVSGPADQKRAAAWCEYGYPGQVSDKMLYDVWRRGGYAFGAVDKIISPSWSHRPEVVEGVDSRAQSTDLTAWDKTVRQVLTPRVWHAFAQADMRRLVTRYAALILRIADDKALDQPVTGGEKKLVEAIPVWSFALEVKDRNPSTGEIKMWNYKAQNIGGTGEQIFAVHPDRLFLIGDATNGAVGFLEPVYNNFVNLEKISGGSGESFLKNAARQLHMNFDSTVNFENIAKAHGVKVDELQKEFQKTARDLNIANDLLLITQGAEVTPMVAQVADPKSSTETNLWEISSGLGIPQKILVGNQTGERASTEDQKQHNARIQSRRVGELSFDISDFVAHLQRIKVIGASGAFQVLWPDLTVPTASDRLANGLAMSQINEKFEHTGEMCFTVEEVRTASGYEPSKAN